MLRTLPSTSSASTLSPIIRHALSGAKREGKSAAHLCHSLRREFGQRMAPFNVALPVVAAKMCSVCSAQGASESASPQREVHVTGTLLKDETRMSRADLVLSTGLTLNSEAPCSRFFFLFRHQKWVQRKPSPTVVTKRKKKSIMWSACVFAANHDFGGAKEVCPSLAYARFYLWKCQPRGS